MQDLEIISIASGNFTANGAFSGYSLTQGRVHIFARQMEAIGVNKDNVTFPFPVIAERKSYNWEAQLGEDGKVVRKEGEIKDRLQALAVFKNEEDLTNAIAADQGLKERVRVKVAKKVKSLLADLSPEAALGA
jgi:hypothetical protein